MGAESSRAIVERTAITYVVRRFFLLLVTAVAVILVVSSILTNSFDPGLIESGTVSRRSIRATRDLYVEDVRSTDRRRDRAEKNVKRVFVFNDTEEHSVAHQIRALLDLVAALGVRASNNQLVITPSKRTEFSALIRAELSPEEWEILASASLRPALEHTLHQLLQPIFRKGVLSNKHLLETALNRAGAVIVRKSTGLTSTIVSEASLYDVKEANEVFETLLPPEGFRRGPAFETLVPKLARYLIRPNVVFDTLLTERAVEDARASVVPVFHQIRRGEMIVRAGDVVTPLQAAKLTQLRELLGARNRVRAAVGSYVIVILILVSVFRFASTLWNNFRPHLRDLVLMSLTLVGSLILLKLSAVLGEALNLAFPDVEANSFMLLAPVAAGGILLQVILGPAAVLIYLLSFTLVTGIFFPDAWDELLLIVVGNIAGVIGVGRASRRSAFVYAALKVAIANVLAILACLTIIPEQSPQATAVLVLCGIFSGLLSGVLAAGIIPVAEFIGGYITDFKLLELASLDRPLLRELSLQAPGTWNHSVIMGQLGETAAEAIGANGLLTRVGAYYHDIGKARKPLYFVENQQHRENRHDKLTPSMSALIIRSHVKDGVEMAKQHRLPQSIVDFIPQHHGTGLIEYFYEKALREAQEGDIVEESHYRYPGPKPQTKEAGILMLADSVEAASRTLTDPTPARIQGMVQKMINKVFASGQLDESELTLKDLHLTAKSFTRVLSGILHRRIEYAEPAEKTSERTREPEKKEQEKQEPAAAATVESKTEAPDRGPAVDGFTSHEANGHGSPKELTDELRAKKARKEALKRLGL